MISSRLMMVLRLSHLLPWLGLMASLASRLRRQSLGDALAELSKPIFLVAALAGFFLIVARAHTGGDFRARAARASVLAVENFVALVAFVESVWGPAPTLQRALAWVAAIAMIAGALMLRAATRSRAVVHGDASTWIWGVFYRNAADRSLWVEKASGLGYTLNFARWQAWLIFGLVAAFAFASMLRL
jgi:hypothetical protein